MKNVMLWANITERCDIIDTGVPGDVNGSKKEKEKIERYQELNRKIKRICNVASIKVIPVVVRALGSILEKLKNCIEELGVVISAALLQKTALLGTPRILKISRLLGY